MIASAASDDPPSIAAPVLILLLLGGSLIYFFGYARAVMHRANKDYKTTKAAVPGLRKGFWEAWRAAVKFGFWIAVGLIILVAWTVHDAKEHAPAPAATTVPPPTRSHR